MTRVAALAMYDGPGARVANDRLWAAIAARLAADGVADVPPTLDRDRPVDAILGDPALLFAQCCGLPLAARFRGRLRVVATPRYAVPGCDGAHHRSRIVVRADDPATALAALRGARAAVNERGSNTGANLFRAAVAPLAGGRAFFAGVIETGSHAASVAAVADGRADVAAIDAVSFAHLARDAPALVARVRTLGWTAASPCLPFVTAAATPDAVVAALRAALRGAVAGADQETIAGALFLTGIEILPANAYDATLAIIAAARALGYPELT